MKSILRSTTYLVGSYHAVDTDKSVFCNSPRSRSPLFELVRGFHNPDLESGLPEVEPQRELELELILHGNIFAQ